MPSAKWRAANPVRSAYIVLKANAKRKAKEKGIPFEKYFAISFEYFKEFAIRTELLTVRGRKSESYTVDRKNPLLGYVEGNLQCLKNGDNASKGTVDKAIKRNYCWEDNGNGGGQLKIKNNSYEEIEAPF